LVTMRVNISILKLKIYCPVKIDLFLQLDLNNLNLARLYNKKCHVIFGQFYQLPISNKNCE